jgi:holin-like protein
MIRAITYVLAAALAGDLVVRALGLPIPGPAVGMAVMGLGFYASGGVDSDIERLFDAVAPHFPIFFIPAAVGFVASLDILAAEWLAVSVAILFSTVLAIAAVGLIFEALIRLTAKECTA